MLKTRVSLLQFYIVNLFILQDACVHLKLEEAAFCSGQEMQNLSYNPFYILEKLNRVESCGFQQVPPGLPALNFKSFLDISDAFWISPNELLKLVRPRRMVVKFLRVALHAALAQLQPLLAAQQHQNLRRFRCPQKSFFELTWYRNLDERCKKHNILKRKANILKMHEIADADFLPKLIYSCLASWKACVVVALYLIYIVWSWCEEKIILWVFEGSPYGVCVFSCLYDPSLKKSARLVYFKRTLTAVRARMFLGNAQMTIQ